MITDVDTKAGTCVNGLTWAIHQLEARALDMEMRLPDQIAFAALGREQHVMDTNAAAAEGFRDAAKMIRALRVRSERDGLFYTLEVAGR